MSSKQTFEKGLKRGKTGRQGRIWGKIFQEEGRTNEKDLGMFKEQGE